MFLDIINRNRLAVVLALACVCVAALNFRSSSAAAGGAAFKQTARADEAASQVVATPKANGKIAFTSGRGTNALDIFVMNPDGSGLARLTNDGFYDTTPAWSPDGRTLAFVSNRHGGSFNIYLMNDDGTNVRRLTNSSQDEGAPAWSPDGTKVAFARGIVGCIAVEGQPCPGPDLYVINADGTNEQQLTTGRVGDTSPAWSPDGTKIAFTSLRTNSAEIFLMNPDGTGQVNITNNSQSWDTGPSWSPDGARIAFSSGRAGRSDIYVMNADGSAQTNLTGNTTNEIIEGPAWSPDGRKIVFARFLLTNGGQGANRDLFVMDADGTDQTRLTTDPDFDVEPAWQPLALATNGRVTFTSERDGNHEVYAMNPDGSAQTNLTLNAARDFNPVWSPDGTKVLFASTRGGGTYQPAQFYVMNTDGSGVTQITNFPDGTDIAFSEPSWSPDSTKIVFINTAFGILQNINVMNADGTGATQHLLTTRGIAFNVDPAWSPDGTRIAFVGMDVALNGPSAPRTYLYVVNADGTALTKIAEAGVPPDSGPTPLLGGPAWSPDGSRLAFTSDRDGNAEIYVIPASGGIAVRLTDNAARDLLPAWSPDASKIAFTSDRDGNQEIYSMNADGSAQTRLTNAPAPDHDPDWGSAGPRTPLPQGDATVQFDDLRYSVSEGTPVVTIRVTRLGDLSREATVDYTTVDICADTPGASCIRTASERSDFTIAVGRLRFAAGETSKTFDVHITNDLRIEEGGESFAVRLANAVGAGLGGQSYSYVHIVDDDTSPPAGNPIDERQFFVRQHYLDFFSREPDTEGFNFWVNQIPASCGFSNANTGACLDARENVSAAFFLSIEFQETGFLAYRFHRAAFNRFPQFREEFLPDTQEIGRDVIVNATGWQQRLEQNKVAYARAFVERPAFTQRYLATMTPAQFVDVLRANTGGAISQTERDQLVAQLTANNTNDGRALVLRAVADDADFVLQEKNPAFVLMQYFGYLRRNPNDPPNHDLSGYNFWLTKLNNHGGDFRAAEMVRAFLLSGEYRSRFDH